MLVGQTPRSRDYVDVDDDDDDADDDLTLSDAGVWRLNLGRGGAPKAPPPIRGTFSTPDPKNGSQPQTAPRLRCYNIKRPQKLCAIC